MTSLQQQSAPVSRRPSALKRWASRCVPATVALAFVATSAPLAGQSIPEEVGARPHSAVLDATVLRDSASQPRDSVWFLLPSLLVVHNTELPSFGSDGALWAGRGTNLLMDGGVAVRRSAGTLTYAVRFQPAIAISRNRPFFVFPGAIPGRSSFSSPWLRGDASIDLPLRFGERPITELHLGQSFAAAAWNNAEFGFSTANQWWGPGRRNALVLSDNAPGFAHVFVGTANPINTRLGAVDGKILLGSLTESRFFDRDDDNDARSINGAFIEFRPAGAPALTVGFARLVVAPVPGSAEAVVHALDFLTRWPTSPDSAGEDEPPEWSSDQITSLFIRWTVPTLEVYAEWARTDLPRSLTDLLVTPHASQAYTVGMKWSNPVGSELRPAAVRLQAEFTNLEQTATDPTRATTDYYAGRATAHGFTHRGQLLGAAIGPGASSQFFAADHLARTWRAGLLAGRARTENDAMYRMHDPRMTKHDVTIYAGIRGGLRTRWSDIAGELVAARRLNYLFQSEVYNAGQDGNSIDVSNLTFSVAITPVR